MKIKTLLVTLILLTSMAAMAAESSNKITAESLLDGLRNDLQALSADFVQYETDANANRSENSIGKVWLQAPNKFKWQYEKPVPQLIVANGQTVWIYDEDLEQVTIKQQKNRQNPIYVLLDKERTEANYSSKLIAKQQHDESAIQWVSLRPKIATEDVKVVWLGIEDKQLKILKLQNQLDNIVVFEFNHIKRNPELSTDFFEFEPPKGTDIMRESAINPEF
ncbi:MAG TPA: outer membrane lipoprotein chaperone LolA [Oceanospirillales bacterium]|nr:outer membrane lipoprotein chaperone LolA [Oceanospirillales bacterium]